jgi:F0F1-type ATP synthase assembly protein I
VANLGKAEALAVAWSLGWRIAAGIIIGYYADKYLGTVPWLTLGFSMTALITGVRSMLKLLASNSSHDETGPRS